MNNDDGCLVVADDRDGRAMTETDAQNGQGILRLVPTLVDLDAEPIQRRAGGKVAEHKGDAML